MYKVKINNLEVFGFHGIYDHEEKKGQNFYIDIEYIPKKNIDLIHDNIKETVDYMNVISDIARLFNKKRYSLIEVLGSELLDQLIDIYAFMYVKIVIRKKIILDMNKVDYISIEVEKKNE